MGEKHPISKSFVYISALLALSLWGGWAYYINHNEFSAAIAQGSASFLITLFMVHAVTYFYQKISYPLLKIILPAVITVFISGVCLVAIHLYVGTQNILLTISPPLVVAFSFCIYTTWKLTGQNHE